MIPNTTPTPNLLFNGEMKKMRDPELRVVMIVTRATFGWIMDEKTGMRKEEDWISHSQMVERSGKSSRAISYAIASCIENQWIEARDEEGNSLKSAEQRRQHGRKIFYRLGPKFLNRVETIANGAMVEPSHVVQVTIANNDTKPSHDVRTTKEIYTKETLTKDTAQSAEDIEGSFIKLFGGINPSYGELFKRKTQRAASIRLLKLHPHDWWGKFMAGYALAIEDRFCPKAMTPAQMEDKFAAIMAYARSKKTKRVTMV